MRRLLLVLLLLAVPAWIYAQPANPTDVAHGSEKAGSEAAHPNEEHGSAHEEPKFLGMPAWIFKLINLALFIGALGYLIGKPVKGALAERSVAIKRAADEARDRRERADRVAGDIQARLKQVEDELQQIRARAEQEGERQKKELIAAAEVEAARIIANAKSEVDNRLKNARTELTEFAGQLAAERAEQIVRDKITPQDQAKLFRESLAEVGEVRS